MIHFFLNNPLSSKITRDIRTYGPTDRRTAHLKRLLESISNLEYFALKLCLKKISNSSVCFQDSKRRKERTRKEGIPPLRGLSESAQAEQPIKEHEPMNQGTLRRRIAFAFTPIFSVIEGRRCVKKRVKRRVKRRVK